METLGIYDIQVKKLTRISNRCLKSRFDEKIDIFSDYPNLNYRKCLEYLFIGEDPDFSQEILNIIDNGFKSPKVYLLIRFSKPTKFILYLHYSIQFMVQTKLELLNKKKFSKIFGILHQTL